MTKGTLSIDDFGDTESMWRTVATNGRILAGSTEGYHNASELRAALVTSTAIQLAALTADEQRAVLQYASDCIMRPT